MKIKLRISISANQVIIFGSKETEYMDQAAKFFSKKALDTAFYQTRDSTSTVVFMSPTAYLSLIDPGDVYLDTTMVKGFIDKSIRYDALPYLGVETDSDSPTGDIYVSVDGRDHAGRRMMKALQGLGIEAVPVVIHSLEYDDGPAYHWGSTTDRPKNIECYGEDDPTTISFPSIQTW